MTKPELTETAEKELALAMAAFAAGDTVTAMSWFERALKLRDFPGWYSYLGYCIAKERGQLRKGLELCLQSRAAEPDLPVHFLNLARIHLLSGDKATALQVLREGIAKGGGLELKDFLENLGKRKPVLLPMLPRSNPLNRYLGLLLTRLGLR